MEDEKAIANQTNPLLRSLPPTNGPAIQSAAGHQTPR